MGWSFAEEFAQKKNRASPTIILITARAGKANYLDAMDSGVDDFLGKPFERDRLLARVRVAMRILDLHQRLRLANTDLERRVEERTAELEKALQVKREFLSRASHEPCTLNESHPGVCSASLVEEGANRETRSQCPTNFRKWPEALDADRSHPRNFKGGSKQS